MLPIPCIGPHLLLRTYEKNGVGDGGHQSSGKYNVQQVPPRHVYAPVQV